MRENKPALRIGILLPGDFRHPSELLPDAGAFDAAGADSLWLDGGAGTLVVMGAVAVAAPRARLGILFERWPGWPPVVLATLQRLSRNRLLLAGEVPPETWEGWPQDVAEPARYLRSPEALEPVSGGGEPERWVSVTAPENRAAWSATLDEQSARGVTGLLVPADPRLLDILRNPDPGEGRPDLQLAQG